MKRQITRNSPLGERYHAKEEDNYAREAVDRWEVRVALVANSSWRAENQNSQQRHQFGAFTEIEPPIAEGECYRSGAIGNQQEQANRQQYPQAIALSHDEREGAPCE